ncbi:Uncharacterised protein [Mycobacteroides abscessus subsp. massiliense]|nr:Uncharacterised protein [Mycobacteroides abscessus subsp. massiliense]
MYRSFLTGSHAAMCAEARQRRGADNADDGNAVLEQCDEGGPDGDAAREVLGAVDGIDDPLPARERGLAAVLLAQHRIGRT